MAPELGGLGAGQNIPQTDALGARALRGLVLLRPYTAPSPGGGHATNRRRVVSSKPLAGRKTYLKPLRLGWWTPLCAVAHLALSLKGLDAHQ
jgi:hypothetical protein